MKCLQSFDLSIGKWHERGSTAVEFALILPILLMLLFGIIDFGRLLYTQEVLNTAVREGARLGIKMKTVPVSDQEIQAQVTTVLLASQLVDVANVTNVPIVRWAVGTSTNLQVVVQYDFSFLVANVFIPGLSQTRAMNATSIMRMEGT